MRRIVEFDSLRGIAAIAVVLFHLKLHRYQILGSSVDLFFVLSGFLITRIILDESGNPGFFRVFYARRSLRIFPVYYLAILAVLLTNRFRFRPDPLEGLWQYLTYTQNVEAYLGPATDRFSKLFQHSWTLAVEEQFYLIWPLLVGLVGRRGVKLIALPLIALAVALRAGSVYQHLLLTRCDGLVLGAWLAALVVDDDWIAPRARRLRLIFGSLIGLGFVGRWAAGGGWPVMAEAWPGIPWHMIGFSLAITATTLAYLGVVGLVLVSSGARWLAPLRDPRLCYLGTISYGIYLWHPIVGGMVLAWHTQVLKIHNGLPFFLLSLFGSIAVAAVSWHAFEKPILRLKDRFTYARPAESLTAIRGPHFGVDEVETPAGATQRLTP